MNCSATEQFHSDSDAVAGSRGPGSNCLGSAATKLIGLGGAGAGNIQSGRVPRRRLTKRLVAALDKQYQKAVEQNDAATMARILSDDFVLVVGNGKVYTKS